MAGISVNVNPNCIITDQKKCGKCDDDLLNKLCVLVKALQAQTAQKAQTDNCTCRYSDPHMMNGELVRKLIQCTICADINRAQSALSKFRSADGVLKFMCKCNKH